MGLFISINGWSENVVPLLKQNAEKNIILADGYDVRAVLCRRIRIKTVTEGEAVGIKSRSGALFVSGKNALRSSRSAEFLAAKGTSFQKRLNTPFFSHASVTRRAGLWVLCAS